MHSWRHQQICLSRRSMTFLIRRESSTGRSISRAKAAHRWSCGGRCRHCSSETSEPLTTSRRRATTPTRSCATSTTRWRPFVQLLMVDHRLQLLQQLLNHCQRCRHAVQPKSVSWSCSHQPSHVRSTLFQLCCWRSWSTHFFRIWLTWSTLHCVRTVRLPSEH